MASKQHSPAFMAQPFDFKLAHELTQLDIKESARERRVNVYRLGHYLAAKDRAVELVAQGKSESEAFAECFTPTRGMHGIAERLGLALDVDRGRWVPLAPVSSDRASVAQRDGERA